MITVFISGKQGSGKTTTSDELAAACRVFGRVTARARFAQPLYEMHDAVLTILANYGIQRPIVKDGPLLQLIGTEWGRNTLGENVWVNCIENKRSQIAAMTDVLIIDDMRFPNEFDVPTDSFGPLLKVRLECPRDERKRRCETVSMWRPNENHPSEIALDEYSAQGKFDMTFDTSLVSTGELVDKILGRIQYEHNRLSGGAGLTPG